MPTRAPGPGSGRVARGSSGTAETHRGARQNPFLAATQQPADVGRPPSFSPSPKRTRGWSERVGLGTRPFGSGRTPRLCSCRACLTSLLNNAEKVWEPDLTATGRGTHFGPQPPPASLQAPRSLLQQVSSVSLLLSTDHTRIAHQPPPRCFGPSALLTVQAGWMRAHARQGLQNRVELETRSDLEFSGGSRLRRGGPGAGQGPRGFKGAAAWKAGALKMGGQ